MITKKEIVRKFNLALEKCRELENKGEKGQIRTTKGQSVENLATDLITLAYSKKGYDIEKLNFSSKKIPISIEEEFYEKLPDYAKKYLKDKKKQYNLKVDLHLFYDEKFICGVECKSYTENAMLKRILFDFVLLKNRHESIRTILFQLENFLGGEDLSSNKPKFSPSTYAILSRVPNINLNIITVFKKDRNINQRIEYSGIKLTIQDIDRAIDKFIECLEL